MTVHNADIARVFDEIADLLEIQGENAFRIRAYRNAARTIGEFPRDLKGDLHAHTTETDGRNTLREPVKLSAQLHVPEPTKKWPAAQVVSGAVRVDSYRIIPIPTTHSHRTGSVGYIVEAKRRRFWSRLRHLDLVITDGSYMRKGDAGKSRHCPTLASSPPTMASS